MRVMERFGHFLKEIAENIGYMMVYLFHISFLFLIGGVIVWASYLTLWDMIGKGQPSVDDILLLFIYLELGAMVGIYFTTNRMPVNFLIYVVITALTRHEVGILGAEHHKAKIDMLIIPAAIVMLAISVVLLKMSRAKFMDSKKESDTPISNTQASSEADKRSHQLMDS